MADLTRQRKNGPIRAFKKKTKNGYITVVQRQGEQFEVPTVKEEVPKERKSMLFEIDRDPKKLCDKERWL